MRKTKALLEAQLRGLTEDNEQLREDLRKVKAAEINATNLAVKAWEEHRFAVARIGDLHEKLGAMTEAAKQACEIVRKEERNLIADAIVEGRYKGDIVKGIRAGEHVSIPR